MKLKWCIHCVLPNSRPNLVLNEENICNACLNHLTKKKINWKSRYRELKKILETARIKSGNFNYDCLIPVSGGKDSTWQVVKCLEFGLKPLTVTWKTPGRTNIGSENLSNLLICSNTSGEKRFSLTAKYRSTRIMSVKFTFCGHRT